MAMVFFGKKILSANLIEKKILSEMGRNKYSVRKFLYEILYDYIIHSYTIEEPPDGMWGGPNPDGTWNGMVGMVKRGVGIWHLRLVY